MPEADIDRLYDYDPKYLAEILSSVKTIAMVGASGDKTKFSYGVLRQLNEIGYDALNKKKIISVDKNYIRPLDVNTLLGNAAKARKELKWKPQINIHTLIDEMITEEMNILTNDQ